MNQESIMLAGTIAAFLAAIVSILDKLLSLQARFHGGKERKEATVSERPRDAQPARTDRPKSRVLYISSFLLLHEVTVIVAAGNLLNYLGLVLSLRLESILYLDMTGTALAAFLLGPWWGAFVALLSSSLVNWLLFPEPGADVLIFPWSLVNMTGGLFWGFMARRAAFRKYLRSGRTSAFSHIWYLLTFGVLGAFIMSVPGTFVQAALSGQTVFALKPEVAQMLQLIVAAKQATIQNYLNALLGVTWGDSLWWFILNWVQNSLRYIPDKTISVAIALAVLKYAFPLFERELIHGGPDKHRIRDTRVSPLLLGCLYVPSFNTLMLTGQYASEQYWPLWSAPWLIIAGGLAALWRWGPSETSVRQACLSRYERYYRALKPIEREPSNEFCRRLMFATLIVSAFFALCLPILLVDFSRVAFNFFCVVYGFLLAIHLIRVAISQNLSIERADE
ncbi:MAG TPA: hypothetical protein VJM82_01605 [Nitrospiraceae bacterium]|nr:hypothetical protein [Nitrospiraceae bacterium]